jgi:hypothetical protein
VLEHMPTLKIGSSLWTDMKLYILTLSCT